MSGHDYLRVYDGGSKYSDLIKSMTGTYGYTKISSPRNQMFIEFQTSSSVDRRRFEASIYENSTGSPLIVPFY